MMIARWQIDARFGHKQTVIQSLGKWFDDIGSQIGWTSDRVRILTGSVGAPEATVVSEIQISDLSELDDSWDRLASIDAHGQWSKDLEPHVVSGTARWEILRVI